MYKYSVWFHFTTTSYLTLSQTVLMPCADTSLGVVNCSNAGSKVTNSPQLAMPCAKAKRAEKRNKLVRLSVEVESNNYYKYYNENKHQFNNNIRAIKGIWYLTK